MSVVIKNPIINSAFEESQQRLDSRGNPTGSILLLAMFDDTAEKEEENVAINAVRQQVKTWRQNGYPHITRVTRQLLEYWAAEGRTGFCSFFNSV